VVNHVLKDMKTSGQWARLYKRVIPGEVPEAPQNDWHAYVE
jgi:hypothetical protein